MKKATATVFCIAVCIVAAKAVSSQEVESVITLPPIVTQAYGAAGTIIMWHDIDDDEKADYKATYIFKDGRLHQVGSNMLLPDGSGGGWKKRSDRDNLLTF